METVLLKMLFIVSVSAHFGKHVYVQHKDTWSYAQNYCRDHHTDLSPITTSTDEVRLQKTTRGKVNGKFWIGLYRNGTKWKWSGGGNATEIPWADNEPDANENENVVRVCWQNCTSWSGWHNVISSHQLPFFCFNLIVMEDKKPWDEAVEHCRRTHTSLISLVSETEHLLALSKIKHVNITERVWIGLRYLGDRWLWVDGDPLKYRAPWHQGDQDQCPITKRCGALTKGGLWESWACQEKLSFICY